MTTPLPGVAPSSVGHRLRSANAAAPMAVPLVLVCIVLIITTDSFLTSVNLQNTLTTAAILAIPGIAMTFCMAMGEFDLSVGSTVALTGAVACTWIGDGRGTFLAIVAALVVGMVVGLANGIIITKFGVTPFIATLATLVIVRGVALVYTGSRDKIVSDPALKYLVAGRPLGTNWLPMPIILCIVLGALAWYVLNRTRFGRWVCAIGSNRDAAKISGLPVDRIRIYVYMLVGFGGAIWGLMLSAQLQKGNGTLGSGFELDAITVVVIGGTSLLGGRATIIGSILGAVLLSVIRNGLNLLNTPPAYQRISVGLVLIAALALQALSSSGRFSRGRTRDAPAEELHMTTEDERDQASIAKADPR